MLIAKLFLAIEQPTLSQTPYFVQSPDESYRIKSNKLKSLVPRARMRKKKHDVANGPNVPTFNDERIAKLVRMILREGSISLSSTVRQAGASAIAHCSATAKPVVTLMRAYHDIRSIIT